jgi:hypothetical protein
VADIAHGRPRPDRVGGRVALAVVDDEDLVRDSSALSEQRVERDLEISRPAARGNHD